LVDLPETGDLIDALSQKLNGKEEEDDAGRSANCASLSDTWEIDSNSRTQQSSGPQHVLPAHHSPRRAHKITRDEKEIEMKLQPKTKRRRRERSDKRFGFLFASNPKAQAERGGNKWAFYILIP
jgi:hypothetical protein